MRAKVIKRFPGRPDDAAETREFVEGDVVYGDLAEVAVREKWAEELKEGDPYQQPKRGEPLPGQHSNVSGTAIDDFKREAAASAQSQRGGLTAEQAQNAGVAPSAPVPGEVREPAKDAGDSKAADPVGKGKAKK